MPDSKLLDGIAIFVEVINSGSFTLAAQHLNHSTSYISKQVSQLEDRLNIRLLHRTTRSLRLTPEGELYYRQCQQIIHDAEQAENAVSGEKYDPRGTLRVSCPISFGLARLRPILATFTARYPKINIELDLNDRKIDMISEGFDVLIRASAHLEDSNLISRRFMRSSLIVLASPEYLQRKGTPLHPNELKKHQTISYSYLQKPKTWAFKKHSGQITQVEVNSQVTTNSPEMELALCLAGQGITRLPEFNLNNEITNGKLIELFPEYLRQTIDVSLIYPSKKHMSSKVRCFIDFIVDSFRE